MKKITLNLKDMTDSREMMESKSSPGISYFIYLLLAIMILAIDFACFFEIDEHVNASGEIKTGNVSSSITTGASYKIKKINVVEGQAVNQGDVLFEFDDEYAREQREFYETQLDELELNLNEATIYKESVKADANLFDHSQEDSAYYNRFEQYQNGVLLTDYDMNQSKESEALKKEEAQNNLDATKKSLGEKNKRLSEYKELVAALQSNYSYQSSDDVVAADYAEYQSNYDKAVLLMNQADENYESVVDAYNTQYSSDRISIGEVETAKSRYETSSASMSSYQASFLEDLRSRILLLESSLRSNSNDGEANLLLSDYTALKSAVEGGYEFSASTSEASVLYQNYVNGLYELEASLTQSEAEYEALYSTYTEQSSQTTVTQMNVDNARQAYESAAYDLETMEASYLSKLQSTIDSLESEIDSLTLEQERLETTLKSDSNLTEYGELSEEKLKTEAITAIDAEIETIYEKMDSVEASLAEINETLKNSDMKAAYDGTVTLVGELNSGDIVQAGTTLCNLVPTGDTLRVTLYIPENEVAKIKVGQKTEYTFDAMPCDEFGMITGSIISISEDAVTNENQGTKYFIAQADLSATSLSNKNGEVRDVKNGMLVEAKTISGSKKAIVWLLEKINLVD